MQILKGDINQRLSQLVHAEWGQNTNLTGVFELILRKAKEVNLSEEMMPKTILVISDMEFDCCGNLTNYEMIKKAYNVSGYQCPQIAFWNVNGRAGNVPVTVNKQGVADKRPLTFEYFDDTFDLFENLPKMQEGFNTIFKDLKVKEDKDDKAEGKPVEK